MPFWALPLSDYAAPWCSGLTRLPVKEEIGSSNLLGVATSIPSPTKLQFVASRLNQFLKLSHAIKLFEAAYPFAMMSWPCPSKTSSPPPNTTPKPLVSPK